MTEIKKQITCEKCYKIIQEKDAKFDSSKAYGSGFVTCKKCAKQEIES